MFKVVGEAQCLDVLLQAWRHVPLIARESLPRQFRAHPCEERLDLFEFALGACRSTPSALVVGLACIIRHDAMKKENDFFG